MRGREVLNEESQLYSQHKAILSKTCGKLKLHIFIFILVINIYEGNLVINELLK